ncbi:sensor histidine kinase [Pseudobacter ginsenosidimutans]|uniref:GHKL domain-containing protein n=1 Tax=Pseudobacter ginsenosidimutans TaxID=661488 RepID=A0A4Q7N5K6_9BACT|nr:histidine kinase [Pseudobacter ginsenosidimutans]QEC44836.1 GHKL domain-containing protein [Pseudobacter ginsenosidimutans]RZS76328.1 GHKL domain-containing protein [Pseudobacter ginsenosidimutans]
MKLKGNTANPKAPTNPGYLWLAIGAGIPIFMAALFYTKERMNNNEEVTAFLITVFFILGIFMGRYVSLLWASKEYKIPRRIFFWLGVIIFFTIILVFIMAGATLRMSSDFMAFLFMGVPLLILSITSGILIKLIRVTVKGQLNEAKVSAAQSQSELQLLQSQLSPHFLFNTLNNIYGISLTRHDKVPPLLLKLSDLLRYSVYDAKEQFVLLKHELDYIQNYIEFEKIRVGEKLLLYVEIEPNINPEIRIAPLLLIVFIENAFKHAKNTTNQEIQISMQLKTWKDTILFAVWNSNSNNQGSTMLNSHSGFGLESVRKRLALLYPGEYDLSIEDKDNSYSVMLQLKAK